VPAALVAVVGLLTFGACAAPAGPAEDVARQFDEALARSDWSAACALLAPATKDDLEQSAGTPCAEAMAGEGLSEAGPVARVQVFGTMAQARLAQDTLFLTRFRGGWRVLAAGCSPQPAGPYDCRVQGG
jgi:hypothetical protein